MDSSAREQRRQRRVEAAIAIRVQGVDADGQPFDDATTAREISRRGLSFYTSHHLAIYATLTVPIPDLGPLQPGVGPSDFFTAATVIRSKQENEGLYNVGVRFMGATLTMYSSEGG